MFVLKIISCVIRASLKGFVAGIICGIAGGFASGFLCLLYFGCMSFLRAVSGNASYFGTSRYWPVFVLVVTEICGWIGLAWGMVTGSRSRTEG